MNKPWFVIHTLFKRETIAQEAITKRGLLSFLPQVCETKPDGIGKWKKVKLPLFPRYLFVRAGREEISLVKNLQGVAYIVKEGDSALAVPEIVIEEIKCRIFDGFVRLDDESIDCPFKPDEPVMINTGFATGLAGVFKQWIPAQQKVGILLNILGRDQVIPFHLNQVSPLAMRSEF